MQDDVETAAAPERKRKGKGKGAGGPSKNAEQGGVETAAAPKRKGAGDPAKNPEVLIARMLVRALWQQEWSAANPDAKPTDRKTAWKDTRQTRLEQDLKSVRKALTTMQRLGVTMTLVPRAREVTGEGDEDDGAEA